MMGKLQIVLTLKFLLIFKIISGELRLGEDLLRFPRDLKFGTSTSAFQTEGAWNIDGKVPSNWDDYIHKNVDGPNADVATDSYHKYKEDIEIVHDIGFDYYRMSLSWPRIIPDVETNERNQVAIDHYKKVLDELHARGIEPFVTIYHWDHPAFIETIGSWTNSSIIEYFRNYAEVVFQEFGSRVKFWTTINEPKAFCLWGFGKGFFPVGGVELSLAHAYLCGENMLKAHAEVYHLFNDHFRTPGSKIGVVDTCSNFYPADTREPNSAEIAFQYDCGWLAHPIFSKSGDYPAIMKTRIAENSRLEGLKTSKLPTLSPAWINRIRNTSDYFGLNYYSSKISKNVPYSDVGWLDDSGVVTYDNKSWPTDASSWMYIHPEGLGYLLNKIKVEYDNPSVHILENGLATTADLLDVERINFFYSHIREVLIAINRDHCKVESFFPWSLLDSFEWLAGYYPVLGMVHVNRTDPNLPRTPRLSAHWFKSVLKNRKLLTLSQFQYEQSFASRLYKIPSSHNSK